MAVAVAVAVALAVAFELLLLPSTLQRFSTAILIKIQLQMALG